MNEYNFVFVRTASCIQLQIAVDLVLLCFTSFSVFPHPILLVHDLPAEDIHYLKHICVCVRENLRRKKNERIYAHCRTFTDVPNQRSILKTVFNPKWNIA